MKTANLVFLFLILINQAAAVMVSPARISEERTITVTNNLEEQADYYISDECATADKTQFELKPAQRQSIKVAPKCNGYLEITEETNTAINKMRLPVTSYAVREEEKKQPLLLSAVVAAAIALILFIIVRKAIKKGVKLHQV